MSIEVIPTGAVLGAEIRGINLAKSLDDATFAAIERAYNDHGVIFFRDQQITPPNRLPSPAALARSNSTSSVSVGVPDSPEIVIVSNATEDRPIGVRRAGENWHSDMCYAARPPRGTVLYALEIPDLFGLPPVPAGSSQQRREPRSDSSGLTGRDGDIAPSRPTAVSSAPEAADDGCRRPARRAGRSQIASGGQLRACWSP